MPNLAFSRAVRLDYKVLELLPEPSRAFASILIENGKVSVNGTPQTKAGYKLRADDVVTVDYQPQDAPVIPSIELPILYEDDDCVVINKPLGVLTHARGGDQVEASVASFLRHYVSGITGERAGIVHRLDRATSGVIIGAKHPAALSWLQRQFSQRKVKKQYRAVVSGHLKQTEAIIDMPIERNPKAPATFRVGANGKPASTHYRVLAETNHYTSLLLSPETGRTHQLRVHLAHLGHPIVGDPLYHGQPGSRLYLHAESLEITLPSRQRKTFTAPVPKDFQELLDHDR